MTGTEKDQGDVPGWRPVPDPTELTDKAIAKAVTLMTQYVDGKYSVIQQIVEDRNTSIALVNEERKEQFASLKELMTDRISSMETLTDEKFAAAERQRLEQKQDTKAAVDAALTAQKEAVKEQTTASERAIAKSEAATNKQLEQQQVTVSTAVDALRWAIDEVYPGANVCEFRDGLSAAESIPALKPDLVLLDLLMPKMHGTEVLARLREQGHQGPVVILTADVQDAVRRRCPSWRSSSCRGWPWRRRSAPGRY